MGVRKDPLATARSLSLASAAGEREIVIVMQASA
jgi:hypothetical protein